MPFLCIAQTTNDAVLSDNQLSMTAIKLEGMCARRSVASRKFESTPLAERLSSQCVFTQLFHAVVRQPLNPNLLNAERKT